MLTASCLCGAVEFFFRKSPIDFNICHCRMCQKFHGAAFSPYVWFDAADFEITKGQGDEAIYASSAGADRSFCRTCGSSLRYIYKENPQIIFVSAGIFNEALPMRPTHHIFVRDKCIWHEITDNLPQAETWRENKI